MRLLALFFFLSVAAVAQTPGSATAGEGTFTEGMMRFVLEDFAGALKQFDTFVKVNEKSGAGFYMKSRAESALAQNTKAELSAARAVELDKSSVYYLENYAGILQKNLKNKEAQNAWREMIRLKPEDAEAYYRLLELQADAGESKEALNTLELAERQFGASEKITKARQLILLKENKVDAAIKEGSKMTASNPEFVLNQAAILLNNGQKKEAVKLLEEAIRAHPDLADAYGLLSELYSGEKNKAASGQLMEKVLSQAAFPYSLKVNVLGNHLRAFGDDAAGLEQLLEKSLALTAAYPDQARAHLYSGDISFRLGKPLQAREHYSRALTLDKNQFEVWLALLQINYRLADFPRLEKDADNATMYFPNQPAIWLYLGLAQWQNRHPDDVELSFEEALRLGGSDTVLKAGAQAGLAVVKNMGPALETLAKAHPDNPYVQSLYLKHLLDSRPETALPVAAGLSGKYPENNYYKILFARALLAAKKGEDALKTLGFINPEEALLSAAYFDAKGDALSALGRTAEAQEEWKKALQLDKTNKIIQEKIKQI
ncbi:MAG: tetratricopeptide repeat protein [Leadbetterella sp.]|nr:tetratricopeptide repeat protein [Leadbetterella sp.]